MKKCACGANIKNERYDKCWKCNNPSKNYEKVQTAFMENKYKKVSKIANLSTAEADRLRAENADLMKKNAHLHNRIEELELSVKELTESNKFLTKSNDAFKKYLKKNE